MDQEPTHHISPQLQALLVKAKKCYDERDALEASISNHAGYAQRNQEDRDASDREAAGLLFDIVEIMDREWGFAKPLPKASP